MTLLEDTENTIQRVSHQNTRIEAVTKNKLLSVNDRQYEIIMAALKIYKNTIEIGMIKIEDNGFTR